MQINTVRASQFLNSGDFHMFILDKVESVSGLHQHDYYEFTIVLTGSCYQEINGRRVLLERGDFVFIPIGSHHQTFYDFGMTRILNMGISRSFFDEHYLYQLPFCFVASQKYQIKKEFLTYIESIIASLDFRDNEFDEFNKLLTFYIVNHLQHYKEQVEDDDIPVWLRRTVKEMHDKAMFGENALEKMIAVSGKSQAHLTRSTQKFYNKTPLQLINEIRINFCKKQLETTNFSIADIAYDAGFSGPCIFIKTFKKLTAFTPGSYRKQVCGG